MRLVKALFLALGLALLYVTVSRIGVEGLGARIASLGWAAVPLAFVFPFVYAANTLGWADAFPKPLPRSVPFRGLFTVRVIGETLNSVIPWGVSLGGEAVKAYLLKRRYGVPAADTVASLLLVHTTLYVSLNAFALGALAMALAQGAPSALVRGLVAFLLLLGAGAALLFGGLRWGLFERLHGLAERLGLAGRLESGRARFAALDADVRRFYASGRRRFWTSSAWNLAAWLVGVVETWGVANALGMPIGFAEAWLFEALITAVRVVTFFIPASVGAQEGGIVGVAAALGYAAPQALAFAAVRRARELLWIAVGLAFYARPEGTTRST